MSKFFVQPGNQIGVTAPAGGVSSGDPVQVGALFGVALDDALAAASVIISTMGIHKIAKVAAQVIAEGDKLYFDTVNAELSTSPEAGDHVAVAHLAATGAATRVTAKLTGHPHVDALGVAKLELDATGGLAIGSVFGDTLPDNAIVTRAWYEVLVTFADGVADAATIALGIETDDVAGIVAAVAISGGGNVWDAGLHEAIQDGTVTNFTTKTTAAGRRLQADVAGVDLTAGRLILNVEYHVTA